MQLVLFVTLKINDFQGDLTDVLVKTKTLVRSPGTCDSYNLKAYLHDHSIDHLICYT